MPGSTKLLAALVGIAVLAGGIFLIAGGASADDEFRTQARAACQRQADREAQRTYIGDVKRALEAHRTRLSSFLADLRKIEPTDEARPEWTKIVRIYETAVRRVEDAQKKLTGKDKADRKVLADVESDVDAVYAQPSSLFPKAGLPECDIPRTAVVKDAESFRIRAEEACTAFIRAPFLVELPKGRNRQAALRQLARLRKMVDTAAPKGADEVPRAVAGLYRRHMLDPIGRMRRHIEEAEGRVGDRAPARSTVARAVDEFDDFYTEYLDGAYTLRLDKCLGEQASLTAIEETFERDARRLCAPVARQLARAADRKSLPALRTGARRLDTLLDRLAKLRPPARTRRPWRTALRAGRDLSDLLNELIGKAGTLSATQVEAYQRRLTSKGRRASRAFVPVGIPACSRVF